MYSSNWTKVKQYVQEKVVYGGENANFVRKLINDEDFEQQLSEMQNFQILVDAISDLELSDQPAKFQVQVIKNLLINLPQFASDRLQEVLNNNPAWKRIDELIDEDLEPTWSHALLTTVDCERSFSDLTNLLTDRRQSMTEETVKQHMINDH